MNDPRTVATRFLGTIDWQNEVAGFCRCPGAALHTSPTGRKDCRVNVDGVPTIYCFHSSCIAAVSEANRRLRREIGASPWEIALPGGQVLRSGDVLQKGGLVKTKEEIMAARRDSRPTSTASERLVLETVRVNAEQFRAELFEVFRWTYGDIMADSPLKVCERDAEDQFRTWLRLWPAHCHVWIGDVFSSGNARARMVGRRDGNAGV